MNKLMVSFIVTAISSAAIAQEQGPIRLQHEAQVRETYVDAAGAEQTRLVPAAKVVPGELVVFTVTYTNEGSEPADNVVITNPVPNNMSYVAGSAAGAGSAVTFSVDDGANWGEPGELTVVDAEGNSRTAQPADYTNIRWVLDDSIPPATAGSVRFTAALE